MIDDRCRPDVDDCEEGGRQVSSRCCHDDVMTQPETKSIADCAAQIMRRNLRRPQYPLMDAVETHYFVHFPERASFDEIAGLMP